jgi:adenylate cyclase
MNEEARRGTVAADVELASAIKRRLVWVGVLPTVFGATLVFIFVAFLLPINVPAEDETRLQVVGATAGGLYLIVTFVLGYLWGRGIAASTWAWFEQGRAPSAAERDVALRIPLRLTGISAAFWALAAVLIGSIQLSSSVQLAVVVFDSIILGGVTTCALGYLLNEGTWRPVVTRALAAEQPREPVTPGVRARLTMAWALATGVPLLGIFAVASAGLTSGDITRLSLEASMFLALTAIASGLLATRLVARSVADPIASVRSALARVERGELDLEVPIDDGSEIGLLQAGFNRMAGGLRERERLRALFGKHVGHEVAQAAMVGEFELGGEERDVAVIFVDLVGSTELASRRPPAEVVELLNSFFGVVVLTVEENGGWINKFEGDAALCVFGAPTALEDAPGSALCAARTLRERIAALEDGIDAGIGVSAGRAVAGNIGAAERYEYTVIGDPVNEAARLCELAKGRPERLLASQAALDRTSGPEAAHWSLGEDVTLRGRSAATKLAITAAP